MSLGSKSTSSSHTTQTEANQQVGLTGGGIALGAGSTAGNITITTSDQAALDLSQHVTHEALSSGVSDTRAAITANANVANTAMATSLQGSENALAFGEFAMNSAAGLAGQSIDAIRQSQAQEETLLAGISAQQSQLTQGAVGTALQIAANAAPQTAAAQSELMSGTSPLGGLSTTSLVVIAIAVVVSVYIFTRK